MSSPLFVLLCLHLVCSCFAFSSWQMENSFEVLYCCFLDCSVGPNGSTLVHSSVLQSDVFFVWLRALKPRRLNCDSLEPIHEPSHVYHQYVQCVYLALSGIVVRFALLCFNAADLCRCEIWILDVFLVLLVLKPFPCIICFCRTR